MNVTIENFNKIIKKKVYILNNLCINNNLMYINKIEDIYISYILIIGNILKDYNIFYDCSNKNNMIHISNLFNKIIENNCILNKLDSIYKMIIFNLQNEDKYNIESNKFYILDYKNNYINPNSIVKINNDKCNCVNSVKLDINDNEIVCDICGWVYNKTNKFSNIDDTNIIKYDFLRHYRIWLEKILATNDKYLNKYQNEFNIIKNYIEKEYPLIQQRKKISISQLRELLKKLNVTKLNDLISLLMKKICYKNIPTLTAKEITDLENLFINIIKVFDSIKEKNDINRKYYPYFIYKIIEFYFKDNKEKLVLLSFVHLQKAKTLYANDKLFKKITEKIPHLITYYDTVNVCF
jgi:hypothetical protein